MSLPTIGVIDTTFAQIDMGSIVIERLASAERAGRLLTVRTTVPGFKDLAAASRRAIDAGAELVIALGMPGPEPIDESCAADASAGLQTVQALTGTPVLEVFVHMSEALDSDGRVVPDVLAEICRRRCEGHADNAVWMALEPDTMIARAGTGRRQGADDAGMIAP